MGSRGQGQSAARKFSNENGALHNGCSRLIDGIHDIVGHMAMMLMQSGSTKGKVILTSGVLQIEYT